MSNADTREKKDAQDERGYFDDSEDRTFDYKDMASVTVNATRPVMLSLEELVRGGLISTHNVSREAYRELQHAMDDLHSLNDHVDAAMSALGHEPCRSNHISLGALILDALLS